MRGLPSASDLPVDFDGYELSEFLGEGGMSCIYRTVLPDQGECEGAIKLLKRNSECFATAIEFIERFRQEAALGKQLKHKHLCTVYDSGSFSNGIHYLLMEELQGGTLKSRRGSFRAPTSACTAMVHVSEALSFLHKNRVIHRDVKPSNIMFRNAGSEDNNVVVTDYGLAVDLDSSDRLTFTGTFYGTPDYSSPEQLVDSKSVDVRTDIYSVGVVLFWLLTGELPHPRHNGPSVITDEYIQMRLSRPPSNLRDFGDYPSILNSICRNCLQRERERRYKSIDELRAELSEALDELDKKGIS